MNKQRIHLLLISISLLVMAPTLAFDLNELVKVENGAVCSNDIQCESLCCSSNEILLKEI